MAIPSNFFGPLLSPDAGGLPLEPLARPRRLPELPPLGLVPAPPQPLPTVEPAAQQPAEPEPVDTDPGVLGSLKNAALSGLATVGNVLDLPGSMVRDVLAWENPFDQLLSPTSGENRTGGRELLTKWGLTNPNDPDKWEAADFAGFGAEVLLDPLSFLSLGGKAVGKAGAAAKDAGLMADLAKVAPATMGRTESRLATTADDLLRARPGEAAADDLAKGLGDAWDLKRGQDFNRSAAAQGVDLSTLSDDALQQFVNEPLGGLASFKVPFTSMDPIPLGTGATAQKVAGKLDDVGRWLHDARIPGTEFAPIGSLDALLNPNIGEATTPMGRRYGRAATAARLAGEQRATKQTDQIFDMVTNPTTPAAAKLAESTTDAEHAFRRIVENVDLPPAGFEPVHAAVRSMVDRMVPLAEEWGMKLSRLADYFPRRQTRSLVKPNGAGARIQTVLDKSTGQRTPFLSGLGQETDTIYQLLDDPDMRRLLDAKASKDDVAELIRAKFADQVPPTYSEVQKFGKVSPPSGSAEAIQAAKDADAAAVKLEADAAAAVAAGDPLAQSLQTQAGLARQTANAQQAAVRAGMKAGTIVSGNAGPGTTFKIKKRPEALAKWLLKLDAEQRASGVFGNHPVQDLAARVVGFEQAFEVATTALTQLADDTMLAEAGRLSRTAERVPLRDVLKELGFDTGFRVDEDGVLYGGGALKKWLELRGQPVTAKALRAAAKLQLPKDFVDNVLQVSKSFQGPDAVGPIVKAYDDFTGMFKTGVLTRPNFHTRNRMSGLFQNFLAGMFSLKSESWMRSILTGKGADVGGIPLIKEELRRKGITSPTPEQAADAARAVIHRFKVIPQVDQKTLPTAGAVAPGATLDDMIAEHAGGVYAGRGKPFDPIGEAKQAMLAGKGKAGTTYNPMKAEYRGIGQGVENTLAPVAAGDVIGKYVEGMNRGAPFLELLRRGVHPAEAARRVKAAQIDYSNAAQTKFGRDVLGRLFPFWKFTSGALPYVLTQLWEQPGGRLAQTLRLQRSASGADATTPDHVAGTAAIPLGEQDDGTKRYLTGFGLMHEDPLGLFGGGVRGGLLDIGSRLNPLLKAPLEWATGESFFQAGPNGGRDLANMDPALGRTLANVVGRDDAVTFPGSDALEFALSNSPLSQILTTARTVTDGRKGGLAKLANLATGVRITDVSPAAQDAVLRERVQQLQRELGARDFTTTSLNAERIGQLSPEDQAKFRELQETMKQLTTRAKERKAARELAGK